MAFPDFEPVDRRSRLLIQPIKTISTDFAIQNVVADYHDRDPLLGVVEIPNELPLQVLLVPRLKIALHLNDEPLWNLPFSFPHQ